MPATNVNWPVPLTRFQTLFPGQFGVPGTDAETGLRLNSEGCIFWVDPNHVDANDGRDGTNPTAPLRTVAAALTKCEAYRGDVIAVMHNGFWTYGDPSESHIAPISEAVTVNVPGVRIVGVGAGSLGVPWCPPANSTNCITINELDVTVEGFCFWESQGYTTVSAIAATWSGVAEWGENFTVRHCYFYNFDDYGLNLDYTYNCFIEDCSFLNIGTAAIYNNGTNGDPDYLVIRNCLFTGNTADIDLGDTNNTLIEGNRFFDVTLAITLDGGSNNQILNNCIQGDPTGANNMINTTGGGANIVGGNYLSCLLAQYLTTCSGAASDHWGGNHCADGDTVAIP